MPNILAIPDEKDPHEVHFVIYGLKECPYEDGVYYGKMSLSLEYPFKSPSIYFITENGWFNVYTKICLEFTVIQYFSIH